LWSDSGVGCRHAWDGTFIGEVVVWDPYLSKFKRGSQPFLPDGEEVIAATRLLLGKVVTVTVRGVPVTLEANAAANVSGLIDAFNRASAADEDTVVGTCTGGVRVN